jgi:hypothetical protein
MTACYCADCKTPLTATTICNENTAFCPQCKRFVETSCFEVPSWIMGVLVILTTITCL